MSLPETLARGRAAALARMLSRATVRRKTGATTTDASGRKVPVWEVAHTDLPCRITGMTRGQSPSRTLDIGGAQVQVAIRTAHLPHDTTNLRDGDLLEVVGESAGVYQIVEADTSDQQTARRVPIVATQRPKEWP